MLFRLLLFTCITFSIGSCDFGADRKYINHGIFLHDRSSKVWLVDKKLQGEKDFTPMQFEYRELVVFHESGNAYFYKINTFGKAPGYKMTFELDPENKYFVLRNQEMTRKFKVKSLGRKRLVIQSTQKNYPFTLVLIPFPEY